MPRGGVVMKIYVNFHLAIGLFNLIVFYDFPVDIKGTLMQI